MSIIIMNCPQCGDEQGDFDGLGVLHCQKCNYCEHASRYGDVCDYCGHWDGHHWELISTAKTAKAIAREALERSALLKIRLALQDTAVYPPAQEYVFDTENGRKWRFDFAWQHCQIAIEIEGGTWSKGRHTRGQGFADDCKKYNTATLQGWKVFRFTADMVEGDLFDFIQDSTKRGLLW